MAAWIEIAEGTQKGTQKGVAALVAAWIEIISLS